MQIPRKSPIRHKVSPDVGTCPSDVDPPAAAVALPCFTWWYVGRHLTQTAAAIGVSVTSAISGRLDSIGHRGGSNCGDDVIEACLSGSGRLSWLGVGYNELRVFPGGLSIGGISGMGEDCVMSLGGVVRGRRVALVATGVSGEVTSRDVSGS